MLIIYRSQNIQPNATQQNLSPSKPNSQNQSKWIQARKVNSDILSLRRIIA